MHERYKVGMIRGLIDRTHKISSSIEIFNVECNKLKQLLINNGYSNSLFDCILKKYVQQKQSQPQETPNQTHDLFYRNQMTSSYKIYEKVLKNIIKQNINCTNENESIKLNIYYKNRNVSNLVMKNTQTQLNYREQISYINMNAMLGIVSPKHIYRIYANNSFSQNYNASPIWSAAQT